MTYWPYVLAVLSIMSGVLAAVHAFMTKQDVRSAIGWVGVILFLPFVGAFIYAVAGINRIRRASLIARPAMRFEALRRRISGYHVPDEAIARDHGPRMVALKALGDSITSRALSSSNRIDILHSGAEAYDAFADAIETARRSVILETYIFDRDPAGLRIADALARARQRGVQVRVLVDAVGARYSVPSIAWAMRERGVNFAAFNGKILTGMRLPYANLRTHRKILVADGKTAFIGGMNIRQAFTGGNPMRDTHFRIEGPMVADILAVAAEDWFFETGERLDGEAWALPDREWTAHERLCGRVIVSGPDSHLETNNKLLMGAFSVAEETIRIMSPYFLPDAPLLAALLTAARRGVRIEIVIPAKNNLAVVARAMRGQFAPLLKEGVRVLRANGRFDHSKLMTVDGKWGFIGSSNIDSRSLRLNFEIDVEIFDTVFAARLSGRIDEAARNATDLTPEDVQSLPFVQKAVDRLCWLASPYL